jgi:hypothetical protein
MEPVGWTIRAPRPQQVHLGYVIGSRLSKFLDQQPEWPIIHLTAAVGAILDGSGRDLMSRTCDRAIDSDAVQQAANSQIMWFPIPFDL